MVSLLCLPTEVITRVFCFLSPKELASCASLSRQFLTIIKTSSILTYALELKKAGLNDTYHLNLDLFDNSPSELLAALRRREQAWSTFNWTKQWDVPVEKVYNNSEICGPVFIGGYTRQGRGIDTIDVYNFHDINTNGLVTTLFLDAPYYGYAIDAGQDLLVLIERYTFESPYYKLQLRKLSTGLEYDHIEIAKSIISLKISSPDRWRSSRSNIQIFGYSLFLDVRLDQSSDMLYLGVSDTSPGRWTMISETEVLFVGYGENVPLLKYYTANSFSPNSGKLEEDGPSLDADGSDAKSSGDLGQVIFRLPFRNNPNAGLARTWVIGLMSSEASFTPKPFSPFVTPTTFVYPPKSQIIGIKFQNAEASQSVFYDTDPRRFRGVKFEMFIHLDLLRNFKNEVSSISSSRHPAGIFAIPEVPWHAWGPSITRVFEDNYDGKWSRRCIRGYRVLNPDAESETPDEPVNYTILDFNVNSSIRDPYELMTCDGTEITSSLPFRRIDIPFSRYIEDGESNGLGIKTWDPDIFLGDDIICYLPIYKELDKHS
ncbi:hypothetical protein Clacol_004441 [Clathrus columnatus]|uniref:F-box domain-containing protein n=1 Tax=Clathrus columnatus TaxID=1419009 RepID=A0AAV5A7F9_9AGAM|nr:hypothetical protein Clacol_004441 [Clathrus columnatus]